MDAQQELFTALKLGLEEKGYMVYDGKLPPDDTPYPFFYLGDFQQDETELKNALIGVVHPVVHVWHNDTEQRGTVSAMLFDVKKLYRKISRTNNYSWSVRNVTNRILPDNTTNTPLLHGVCEADFYFS